MKGYKANIEQETVNNQNFRKVLFTGGHMQLVVMSLLPGEEIGSELHHQVDQFFRVEQGEAKFVLDGEEFLVLEDEIFIVPAGSQHNVINTSSSNSLKLYTIYSPANHPPGTIHATKAEAMEAEAHEHE